MDQTITIQFFATLREQVGTKERSFPLEEPRNLNEVLTDLVERFPGIEDDLKHVAVAVNMERVNPDDATIKPGDEIALLPPFGGGTPDEFR